MLSIYSPPTFDEATRTVGIWLTFHTPPSKTVPPALRQKRDRNYRVCLAVYSDPGSTTRIGEYRCNFRRRPVKDKSTMPHSGGLVYVCARVRALACVCCVCVSVRTAGFLRYMLDDW
jgi:hypothetical protein